MNNSQPALIRAFFASFAEGVLSVKTQHQETVVELTPQRVKQLMLDHYEEISKHYFDILFNPLALVHYEDAEELIRILRSPEVAPTLNSPVDLFKHVCRTEQAHEDMVMEYRRNFTSLMAGHVLSLEEYYDGFPDGYLQDTTATCTREVRALTQVVVNAFFAGRQSAIDKLSSNGENGSDIPAGVNQVYIFRLLIENMQCLLASAPVNMDEEADLNETFLAVCRTPENMNTMLETMQQTIANHINK